MKHLKLTLIENISLKQNILKPNENLWKELKIMRHHLRSCTFRPFGTSLNFRFMDGDK